MSVTIIVLLLFFMVLTMIALPLAFDIGYGCGKVNALRTVATGIPKGLTEEQHVWVSKQMASR